MMPSSQQVLDQQAFLIPADAALFEQAAPRQKLFEDLQQVLFTDLEIQRDIFLLSQYVRFGFHRGLDKVGKHPEVIKPKIHHYLDMYGYAPTDRDPAVWLNPRTKHDGWIIELPEGESIWGGPFVAAGHPDGEVSRDLHRMFKRCKDSVFEDYCGVVKRCNHLLWDELVRLFQSPWFELRKEVRAPSGVEAFFERHEDFKPLFAALFSFSQPLSASPGR